MIAKGFDQVGDGITQLAAIGSGALNFDLISFRNISQFVNMLKALCRACKWKNAS